MNTPIRFSYRNVEVTFGQTNPLPFVPIRLRHIHREIVVPALLDTGATVNVLPYSVGLELGLVWEQHNTPVYLTGNLARLAARGVIIKGTIGSFSLVDLVFAWTQVTETPLILGQVNFFMEFNVCFFRSQLAFEIEPKQV